MKIFYEITFLCLKKFQETYFHERYRKWYGSFQVNLLQIVRECVVKQLPEMYLQKYDELIATDLYG